MTDETPKRIRRNRELPRSKVQENRESVGSRVESTSTTGAETSVSSRPKKK